MKIIFLGTNGWYDTRLANTCCILIDTRDAYLVLDAGNGIHRLNRYCKRDQPVFLFLSHFHLDHIAGLHILGKFSFPRGLTMAGPKGSKKILEAFVNQPFTMPLEDLPYQVRILELPKDSARLPFRVECLELLHSTRTLGYRIHVEGRVIAYCPDTGYCRNAVQIARRADILIAECSFRDGVYTPEWPHLNPTLASKIARQAQVQRLVLTHFDPTSYKTQASRKEAEIQASKRFPRSVASKDGLVIEI
ncbi:MAG: MBL fold metallo-hydrolase [Deltaproteobacteria bacterium]|nr:MBL fold metallo-hydrolase [Deltaproteobacteria bacterium]